MWKLGKNDSQRVEFFFSFQNHNKVCNNLCAILVLYTIRVGHEFSNRNILTFYFRFYSTLLRYLIRRNDTYRNIVIHFIKGGLVWIIIIKNQPTHAYTFLTNAYGWFTWLQMWAVLMRQVCSEEKTASKNCHFIYKLKGFKCVHHHEDEKIW